MPGDLLSIVDAAYTLDVDEATWLRGVATAAREVLDVGLGLFSVIYDASDPASFQLRASVVEGLPDGLGPALQRHVLFFDRPWVEDTILGFTCDHIRNPRLAKHRAAAPELLDELYGGFGVRDIFGINARDPTGIGCQINVLEPRIRRLTPATRTTWSRITAHIAAGNRLRRTLAAASGAATEAVLRRDGKLLHAEGAATAPAAREQLAMSVRALERARGQLRKERPESAIAEWKGLVAARWSLVDQFESDGQRYVVARQNDPAVSGFDTLTPRERCAVGYAALGHSNKLIAYEMGIAASTVAVLLSRAARRLGTRTRAELIREFVAQRQRDRTQ